MIAFYKEYSKGDIFLPQAVAKIPAKGSELSIMPQAAAQLENFSDQSIPVQLALGIPWFHHVILIEKIKELKVCYWYMDQTIENGWSRNSLSSMVKTDAYTRQGSAGKMNFYCSVVDDQVKQDEDQPTIGLILCQTKDKILTGYALRDIHKPISVSDYELTRALPDNLKSSLPSIEEIEKELSGGDDHE